MKNFLALFLFVVQCVSSTVPESSVDSSSESSLSESVLSDSSSEAFDKTIRPPNMAMFFIGSIVCFLPVTLFVFGAFGARTVSYIFNQLTFLRFFGEDLTKPSNSALSSHKKNSMMFLMKILLHINEGSAERGASPQKKRDKRN